MMEIADFGAAFEAIHGHRPFPWQLRLVSELCSSGQWPEVIGVPTGCGKTASIDVALFHLAWCAHHGLREALRRRIVFVVNRRIIVDEAYDRACRIEAVLRSALDGPADAPTTRWARELASLGGAEPMKVWRLRGGLPRERGFARDPLQPIVLTATVDQVGSRLLFRGYGVSDYSKPIHAGLLAFDTLLLADEAHLAEPFVETIRSIAAYQRKVRAASCLPAPLSVVQLTATSRDRQSLLGLDSDDHAHPTLARRINAEKAVTVVEAKGKALDNALADEGLRLLDDAREKQEAPIIAVIANRVATARRVFERVRSRLGEEADAVLLIGRTRPYDRERLMKEWEPRLKAGRERAAEGRPAIVVATQTIEVGADFDFDGLVSELASWDALCQRFGRLNRRGDTDGARGVIVAPVRPPTEDPIYGSAPAAVAAFLKCVGPEIDFSPRNLVELADDVPDAAVSQPTQGPLLTQAMIELFAQTSPLPNPDPDPAYFLHGFGPVEPEVQIVFRSGLPERATTESVSKVQSILSALPPIAAEVLSLPRRAFLHWMRMLEGEREVGEEVVADLEGRAVPEAMSTRSPGRRIWVWTGDDVRIESAASIGPGAVVIVPCQWGGCDAYGFHSEWTEPVSDIAEVALACNESRNRRLRIVLMPERVSCVPWLCPDTDTDAALLRKRIEVALEEIAAANGSPDHIAKRLLLDVSHSVTSSSALTGLLGTDPAEVEVLSEDDRPFGLVYRFEKPKPDDYSDEGNSSSRTVRVSLFEHSEGVAAWAERFAREALGSELSKDLALAGLMHDLGKAEPRFQRFLGGPIAEDAKDLLAKNRAAKGGGTERGERHEAYSASLLQQNGATLRQASDPDLVLHLVGTHHGRGRPLMPYISDRGRDFRLRLGKLEFTHRGAPQLGAVGSDWADRFWRLVEKYGAWGLAYLETLLRLADHVRSEEEVRHG